MRLPVSCVPDAQIHDMQWSDNRDVRLIKIICSPARCYSGRDLFDYKATLWSSWSIAGLEHWAFNGCDTGFTDHLQQIVSRLGGLDVPTIKVGAYGPGLSWYDIYMTRENAVAAHAMLEVKRVLPVHWATFNMALHKWNEPIVRTLEAPKAQHIQVVTPREGEVVTADQPFESDR